jgi:hypothetical protein
MPDDRYRISLSVDGVKLEGSQELFARAPPPPRDSAVVEPNFHELVKGQTFQLSVTVTDPTGKVKDYTGSRRLEYEHFGCLTVSDFGVVSVIPTSRCAGPQWPELWIIFNDPKGNPIILNQYWFQVIER